MMRKTLDKRLSIVYSSILFVINEHFVSSICSTKTLENKELLQLIRSKLGF